MESDWSFILQVWDFWSLFQLSAFSSTAHHSIITLIISLSLVIIALLWKLEVRCYFTICNFIMSSQVFLHFICIFYCVTIPQGSLIWRVCVCVCVCRAHSFASVRTATLESSVRNSMPATTDLVATTAPALMSDRGVKGVTSRAPVLQVCVCSCMHYIILCQGDSVELNSFIIAEQN